MLSAESVLLHFYYTIETSVRRPLVTFDPSSMSLFTPFYFNFFKSSKSPLSTAVKKKA